MPTLPSLDDIQKLKNSGQITEETANQLASRQAPPEQSDVFSQSAEAGQQIAAEEAVQETASEAEKMLQQADSMELSLRERMQQDAAAGIPVEGLRSKYGVDFDRINEMRTQAQGLLQTPEVQSRVTASSPVQPQEESQELTEADFEPAPPQQTQTVNPLVEKITQGYDSAFEKQRKGILDAAEAGKQQGIQEAARLDTLTKQLEKQDEERALKEQNRQQQIDEAETDLKATMQQINDSKVDPNRYWSKKSTGQKILATIGILLSGIGAGMQGSNKNVALEILNKQIDDDIEAQKTELDKLSKVSGTKQNLLSLMRQRFGDERQAEAAAKVAAIQNAEIDLKRVAAQSKSEQVKANAEVAIGQLEALKADKLAAFHKATLGKGVKIASGQGLPPGVDIEDLTPDQRERFVPGMGLATTKAGAKEVRELQSVVGTVDSGVKELLQFTEKSLDSITPADRARAKTISQMLVGSLRLPIVGPGALSEREIDLLNSIIANPTNIFSLDMSSKSSLQTLNERIKEKLLSTAKANGIKMGISKPTTFKPSK